VPDAALLESPAAIKEEAQQLYKVLQPAADEWAND